MKIFVGNLSYEATQDDLQKAFSEYGNVNTVDIIMDRETGRSRGFGFVEMQNADEAKAAIEGLNLQRVGGRAVTVNEARPQADKPHRRGGGGNRGRRW